MWPAIVSASSESVLVALRVKMAMVDWEGYVWETLQYIFMMSIFIFIVVT